VAIFLICLWVIHNRPEYRPTRLYGPIAAAIVLLTPLTPFPGHAVLLIGLTLTTLVAVKLVVMRSAVPAREHDIIREEL
jgi:hypothetical protein